MRHDWNLPLITPQSPCHGTNLVWPFSLSLLDEMTSCGLRGGVVALGVSGVWRPFCTLFQMGSIKRCSWEVGLLPPTPTPSNAAHPLSTPLHPFSIPPHPLLAVGHNMWTHLCLPAGPGAALDTHFASLPCWLAQFHPFPYSDTLVCSLFKNLFSNSNQYFVVILPRLPVDSAFDGPMCALLSNVCREILIDLFKILDRFSFGIWYNAHTLLAHL